MPPRERGPDQSGVVLWEAVALLGHSLIYVSGLPHCQRITSHLLRRRVHYRLAYLVGSKPWKYSRGEKRLELHPRRRRPVLKSHRHYQLLESVHLMPKSRTLPTRQQQYLRLKNCRRQRQHHRPSSRLFSHGCNEVAHLPRSTQQCKKVILSQSQLESSALGMATLLTAQETFLDLLQ